MLVVEGRDKTWVMLVDDPGRGGVVIVRRWLWRAVGLGVCCLACGGLAEDGREAAVSAVSPRPEAGLVRPRRETCDDNPLLAECPYARDGAGDGRGGSGGSGGSGGRSPAPPANAEPPEEAPQIIAQAENILAVYCGSCHGSGLTVEQAPGGINDIDDWDALIEEGLIVPCSPEGSRVVQVIRSGRMPPLETGLPPPSATELGFVELAIALECDR